MPGRNRTATKLFSALMMPSRVPDTFLIKTAPDSGDQTCLLILGLVWDIGVENILVLVSDISIETHDIRHLSTRLIHIHKGTFSFLKSQNTHAYLHILNKYI